jgi:hypothetical protein
VRLTTTERQKLEAALVGEFRSYQDFERLATNFLGINLNNVSKPQQLPFVVMDLFNWAESEGKLVFFLDQVTRCAPTNRVLRLECDPIRNRLLGLAATQQIPAAAPQAGIMDSTLLANRQPFMNREEVRDKVRSMADPYGIRILTVYGTAKSGKSFIHDFLMFLHGAGWLAVNCSLSKVGEEIAADVSPGELAEHIATQFDSTAVAPEKRPTETLMRWALRCAGWLREQFLLRTQKPCWVVLDGFDDGLIDPATLELIKGLARRVTQDLHHVRLVLLGAPITFLRLHQSLSADCEIQILDETHWLNFFLDVAKRAKLDDQAKVLADQWVEEVRLEVPAGSPERFRAIADACKRIVARHLP